MLNSVVKILMMSSKYFEYYTIILRGPFFRGHADTEGGAENAGRQNDRPSCTTRKGRTLATGQLLHMFWSIQYI